MIRSFHNIVDDVKRKPYDLLDYYKTQFDRDYLEFNVNIHDLEMALQVGCIDTVAPCSTFRILYFPSPRKEENLMRGSTWVLGKS